MGDKLRRALTKTGAIAAHATSSVITYRNEHDEAPLLEDAVFSVLNRGWFDDSKI